MFAKTPCSDIRRFQFFSRGAVARLSFSVISLERGNRRSAAGHRKDNVLVTCDLSSAGSRSPPSWPSPGSAAAESRRLSGSGILPMKVGRIQSRCEARPWAAAVSSALIIIIVTRASNKGPHGPSPGWKRQLLALSHLRLLRNYA